jgi:ADP-heptose:LPS heptosyltransferase
MHMAWLSGIPTLALFGSTRSEWSRPLGDHTLLLDSSDLSCGGCMESTCRFGDNHCLTRYTPQQVYTHAIGLIKKLN